VLLKIKIINMLETPTSIKWIPFKSVGKVFHLLFFSLVLQPMAEFSNVFAQEAEGDTITQINSLDNVHAPYVYIDCHGCDNNFIRTELDFVNYVRDPEMADIHVFVTEEGTGGGGREYQFSFIGKRLFAGTEYTLKHIIGRDATRDEIRNILNGYLKMGYASYMLQTPLGSQFSIEYVDNGSTSALPQVYDPWDFWVFQAYLGNVRLKMESNKADFNSRWGFTADRVTEDWKFRINPYFNYGRVEIQAAKDDDPVISIKRRHGVYSHAIKSISDHWSVGVFGTYLTENSRNIRHQAIVSPGIEYSLFPYEMATRKSITFTYQLGFGHHDYYLETIYGKQQENLINHQFEGVVNILQPWGYVETGFSGSQYFHDLGRRRINLFGHTSVRMFEGFSMSLMVRYNVVRDQLGLPKGEASLEDVLLQQRELATDYSFESSIAITYTFGSKFSNIVNTRF
jgi:hypothetical protein